MLTTTKIGDIEGGERERFSTAVPANCNSPFGDLNWKNFCGAQALGSGIFLGVPNSVLQIPRGVGARLGWPGALLAQLATLATVSNALSSYLLIYGSAGLS